MPNIGDEILASEIGRTGKRLFVWVRCPVCTEERWVGRKSSPYAAQSNTKRLCRQCTINQAKRFVLKPR